jgi:hypothetical protein
MKKYRLKIPEMVKKQMAALVDALSDYDGKVLIKSQNQDSYVQYTVEDESRNWCSDIPKDWLEPIVDGPVSADVWIGKDYKEEYRRANHYHYNDMKHAFKAGETNDRKRTQPVIDASKSVISYHKKTYDLCWSRQIEALQQALKKLEEK